MARKPLPYLSLPSADPATQKAFDDFVDVINYFIAQPLVNNYVEKVDVALSTTNTEVDHSLGRVVTRILPLKLNAGVTIYTDTPHPDPRNKVYLKATATCTATLLIS